MMIKVEEMNNAARHLLNPVAAGEETRMKDVKVEETSDNSDCTTGAGTVTGTGTVTTTNNSSDHEESPQTTSTKKGNEKRRRSEFNIPIDPSVKALLPNSTSMPQIHAMIEAHEETQSNTTTAGTASTNILVSIAEKKGEKETRNDDEQQQQQQQKQQQPLIDLSHPHNLLISLLREEGYNAETKMSTTLSDFFLEMSKEHIEAYNTEIVKAVRDRNIPLLRSMHENGKILQCSNKFGESLLHMACRRGYTDVVRFLIKEADVTLRVKDDFGRTPLHDACWSANPNFDLMELIIEHDPDLLLIEDVRGHSPFSYARKSHWKDWNDFLISNRQTLRLKTFT